jgi:hypothetical protein
MTIRTQNKDKEEILFEYKWAEPFTIMTTWNRGQK